MDATSSTARDGQIIKSIGSLIIIILLISIKCKIVNFSLVHFHSIHLLCTKSKRNLKRPTPKIKIGHFLRAREVNIIIIAGDFHGNKELLMTTDKHRNFLPAEIRCPKSGRDSGQTPEIPAEPLYSPLFRYGHWHCLFFAMFNFCWRKCFSESFFISLGGDLLEKSEDLFITQIYLNNGNQVELHGIPLNG